MAIESALSVTNTGFKLAKSLREILKRPEIDPDEIQARIRELHDYFLEAQSALGEAQDEIRALKQRIAEHDRLKELEADLQYQPDGGFYVRKSDGAVCCPACWGDKQKVVPMAPIANMGHRCPIHAVVYRSRTFRDDKRADDSRVEIIPPRRSPWG